MAQKKRPGLLPGLCQVCADKLFNVSLDGWYLAELFDDICVRRSVELQIISFGMCRVVSLLWSDFLFRQLDRRPSFML